MRGPVTRFELSEHWQLAAFCVFALLAANFRAAADDKPLGEEEARKLKPPIAFSKKSIGAGRAVYSRASCVGCHGADGKSQVDVVADATDLTDPKAYKSGSSAGEIFRSIREGQGASMPAFKTQIRNEEDIWNLVNFIRSLWPESMRPPLQESE